MLEIDYITLLIGIVIGSAITVIIMRNFIPKRVGCLHIKNGSDPGHYIWDFDISEEHIKDILPGMRISLDVDSNDNPYSR